MSAGAGSNRNVIVDASQGGDLRLAADLVDGLAAAGLDVELREPPPSAMFDTGIHLLSAGIAIRVPAPPDRAELAVIERVVREALLHRQSIRRRMRSVPVHQGETERIVKWIDAVE